MYRGQILKKHLSKRTIKDFFGKIGLFYTRQIKKHLQVILIVLGSIILAWLVGFAIYHWVTGVPWPDWTGFSSYIGPLTKDQREKTLWDWMGLLFIPLVLAVGVYWFNKADKKNEQETAADQQSEDALQNYIDKMTELLLEKDLRNSQPRTEVRIVARTRTLTTLRLLNGNRKGILLKFLFEAGLIKRGESVVNLAEADLQGAELGFVNLSDADLRGVDLGGAYLVDTSLNGADLAKSDLKDANMMVVDLKDANLEFASLNGADLRAACLEGAHLEHAILTLAHLEHADLVGADLSGTAMFQAYLMYAHLEHACLKGASLLGANLKGAVLMGADLKGAKLTGATMPDGKKYDPTIHINEELVL